MDEIIYTHVLVYEFVALVYTSLFEPILYRFYYSHSIIFLKIWNANSFSIVLFVWTTWNFDYFM